MLAAPLVTLTLLFAPAPAQALTFGRCPHSPGFSCTTLSVPVLRSQPQLGTITLHLARKLSGSSPSKDAVLALAGGPGQPALPLSGYFATGMASALGHRDLVVFDQRGTGESGPLSCKALQTAQTLSELVEQCAEQIGPGRSGYATSESVEDIEAIRQALGYEKLVLYGTSYGTKVALQYAQSHPRQVESLVLDSVVLPEGVEPRDLPTLKAISSVLGELCANQACAGVTSDPLRELAKLASYLGRKSLRGTVYDGSGKRHTSTLNEEQLLEVLLAGDLNPALRAMTPAAVRSALQGDQAPLLRLHLLAEDLVPNLPGHPPVPVSTAEIDTALLIDTTCEDTLYPWSRASPPVTRLAEASAALHALPASSYYPFDASSAEGAGLLEGCAYWPYTTSGPLPVVPVVQTLPDVPTLILSGAQDLRTPTSNAQLVAAAIPDAQLLVVPHTGHSVLGSDFSGCAKVAVEAFFEGAQVLPCGPIPDVFAPTPLIPKSLGGLAGIAGLSPRAGKTLRAVIDTVVDLDRQVIGATLQAQQSLPSGSSFGGLRGGFARITTRKLRLHRFSFVSGVQLSGIFPVRKGEVGAATIQVGGAAAAHGSVRIGAGNRVSGVLAGHPFHVSLDNVATASVVKARHWPGMEAGLLLHSGRVPLRPLARQR